jgi:UV DNA damage endonuclease
MRIGYPCINRSIGCSPSRTFRLASYSDNRLRDIVQANLSCLKKILVYNAEHHLLFLRITSDLVPFTSHPVCNFPWEDHFSGEFDRLGTSIRNLGFRISMHPDQFVPADFRQFLTITQPADFDVMLEINDKEHSALEALCIARGDPRLVP